MDTASPLTSVRPQGVTPALRRLTRRLDALVAAERDPRVVARRAGIALQQALVHDWLLEPRHCLPADDHYRQHIVHVHPAGLYSVVALVWKPGQVTPIHDHVSWCVVGVWRGVEREIGYERRGRRLVRTGEAIFRPGDVAINVPPDEDIHRVENAGRDLAISLHVYGADISELGSSINRVFADEHVV